MARGGRAVPPATHQTTGLFPRLLCLYAHLAVAAASDYGIPIEIKLWDTGRTPLAHMVDVTNGFGLKVLAEHNFLNDNNIAFSPYGLMGILVALFEGVDGESSYQIQRAMQLPWNRNVMRIGFRDIHRTLKTYFVPEEGFLAGLALNNENVTFNDNYKKVLRFYGFDLEGDQLPTFPPGTNSTNETTTASTGTADGTTAMRPEAATTGTPATEAGPTREEGTTVPTREETTTNPNAETINDVDVRIPETSTASAAASNAESTPTTNTVYQTTTQTPTTETAIISTITTNADVPTAAMTSTSALVTESTVSQTASSTVTPTDEPTSNNEVDSMTTRESSVPSSTMTDAATSTTTTISDTTPTESSILTMVTETSTDGMSATETVDSTTITESTIESLERRKRSIVDFIFTNPPYIDDYLVYKSYNVDAGLQPINFDDEKMFLANGLRNVQVTYMHYDTILEHAYLPHLEASALRLPLDSDRYYLLVVLPSRGGVPELGRLLSRMARESDLSDVYEALRPRRVRAIVPSFTVKGHVTLTTDLQKLGVRDVFEPRQRDFTPMTRQPGVYVRSIEQAVSVAIRKYRPDDQKKNRYVHNRQPVRFLATYPFLYFVMDSSIHVALMAGKMVDPLNNRIL
ncbi:serpin H1 [Plodia interpunctella]|uniref:serpin H1 n=1 Tax=Plodia interpunctella TaxID=58824 RepID=UPI0023679BBA|nr:serpin H1 [Plodia interpunctella]